jgi:Lrp/AsnC family transcriptional regulator
LACQRSKNVLYGGRDRRWEGTNFYIGWKNRNFELPTGAETRMDAIDRKILTILQDDSTISIAELAERVHLSQTPCWKRIQKLEANGYILKRVALVSPEKLGLGLTVFVSIETNDHSREWLGRFAETVSALPEVMELYRMAGDVDYMLRVVVTDMAAYDAFYKRLIEAIPLKNVTSRFAMERIKSTTAYAVPALPKP